MESPIEMRVCLLTGAGGLLGRCFCKRFSRTYRIAAVYHSKPPIVATDPVLRVDPFDCESVGRAHDIWPYTIQADLASENDLGRIVDAVLHRFGRVDLLVNAAVCYRFGAVYDESFLESFRYQMTVNTFAPVKLSALLLRLYWRHRVRENLAHQRNILNVSSVSATNVFSGLGQSLYSSAKAALNQLTLHMAAEYEQFGIRVNALAPTSFPKIVPTESVVDEIARIDASDCSGRVVVGAQASTTLTPALHRYK